MGRRCFFDLEADGLMDTVTKIHCGVFLDLETREVFQFTPNNINDMLPFMDTCDWLSAHNAHGYDFPVLEMLHGYVFKGKKDDTMVTSLLQAPNRKRPWQMPKEAKGGPHSLAAWGYRVGRGKPDHDDWSMFSEAMLHRCSEDVFILELVYNSLIEERGELGGDWSKAVPMSNNLFEIIRKQEAYGWLVDQPHLAKSLSMLNHWIDRIANVLEPSLPMTTVVVESKVNGEVNYIRKPFLKSGKYSQAVVNYYGEDCPQGFVAGPFSRVQFRGILLDKDVEVKKYLLDTGWIPDEWNKNKDGVVTSPKLSKNDNFVGVQGSMGRLIARRAQCKARRSIMEGWQKRIRPDGRLPSVITGICVTGRMKHSIIVNTPNGEAFFGKWMRRTFTCAPGKILVGTDAAGCQDRMLAQRAGHEGFMKMLLDGDKAFGTDGHSLAMKAINVVLDAHGLPLIMRGNAKNFNYGYKFGASNNKLGLMARSNANVGLEIREALDATFPAQAQVVEDLAAEWRSNAQMKANKWGKMNYQNGWFAGLDGRPVFVESEHALLVYALQSDEAIMMSVAYILMYKRMIAKGYEWGKHWAYVNFNHDEFTIECNEGLEDIVSTEAEKAIADAGLFFKLGFCPQAGEAAQGINWYEIH